jgi:monoamine oxidase
VYTLRAPFAEGQVAEGGGEYIDGVHTEMLGLVNRFGLELDDLSQAGSDLPAVVFVDGRRRSEDEIPAGVEDEFDEFLGEAAAQAEEVDTDDLDGGTAAELDALSVADAMDELGVSGRARFLLRQQIRGDYAVEPEQLSALYLVLGEQSYADAGDDDLEEYRISGGNDQLPKALAGELESAVSLSQPVTAVSQDDSGVRVMTGSEEVAADFAVLAVPLPVLEAIDFSPEPPPERAAAVGVQYGAATKSLLQFTGRPWIEQGFDGEAFTDLPSGSTWEATDAQPGPDGILVAYAGGKLGTTSAEVAEPQRIERAVADVNEVFPGSAALFSAGVGVAWAAEPFTRGSWVAPAPGQVATLRRGTERPLGRIHLAGEHTDTKFPGYMEGAVRSGQRAAREIMER